MNSHNEMTPERLAILRLKHKICPLCQQPQSLSDNRTYYHDATDWVLCGIPKNKKNVTEGK